LAQDKLIQVDGDDQRFGRRMPGNIRELQNVIERGVIVADSQTLPVDARWFSGESAPAPLLPPAPVSNRLELREIEMIESALPPNFGIQIIDTRIENKVPRQGPESGLKLKSKIDL
jgi:transcriptional regulator with AAA-type ATPase domain